MGCKNYFNDKLQFNNKLQFVGEITYMTGLSLTADVSRTRRAFIVKCSDLMNTEERGHEKKNKGLMTSFETFSFVLLCKQTHCTSTNMKIIRLDHTEHCRFFY